MLRDLITKSIEQNDESNEDEIEKWKLGCKLRNNNLQVITFAIGTIETIFFYGITFYLLHILKFSFFETLNYIFRIYAGWIAIKVIGQYQLWSGELLGRATFYIFLIGSMVNLFLVF